MVVVILVLCIYVDILPILESSDTPTRLTENGRIVIVVEHDTVRRNSGIGIRNRLTEGWESKRLVRVVSSNDDADGVVEATRDVQEVVVVQR